MKKIVITGATSFIGVHLIRELLNNKFEIYAVVRPNSANLYRIPENDLVHVIELDMNDYDRLCENTEKIDAFIHLAWEGVRAPQRDNELLQRRNYECALKALHAAFISGCKVFIGAGSQAEYGKMTGKVDETYSCSPITEYGKMKHLAFEKMKEEAEEKGIRFIWTRIFSLYGKYDYPGTLVMSAVDRMKRNEPIEMTEATQMWDYLYVVDAAKAIVHLLLSEDASGVYNLANGDVKPLRRFIEEIKVVLNSSSELKFGAIPYGEAGPIDLIPDNSKIMRTGWFPETGFSAGIMEMMQKE